jgi:polyisoprenoid-binding protein YceI
LTINGITKSVTLDLKHGGTILDPMDGITKAGFKLSGMINRYDFGLKWNIASAAKSFAVGEEIELVCNMRLNMVSDEVKVTPSAEKIGN